MDGDKEEKQRIQTKMNVTCPPYDGKQIPFKEWRRKVQIWLEMGGKELNNPGAWILHSLSEKAWETVANIQIEEIKDMSGAQMIIKQLEEVFENETKLEKTKKIDNFFNKIERRNNEEIGDYLIRYEHGLRDCKEAGMKLDEETLGYLLMIKANISDVEKTVLMGACKEDMTYKEVKKELRRITSHKEKYKEIGDYLIRYEHGLRDCKEAGMKLDEETLGYLLMIKANISDVEKTVLMGACKEDMTYKEETTC